MDILGSKAELASLPEGKLLINTVNAHSNNTPRKDSLFAEALTNGDVLILDGVSIVKACKWIKAKCQPKEKIAGWYLFSFEMDKLERESEELRTKSEESKIVMFMGSSQKVLDTNLSMIASAKVAAASESCYEPILSITYKSTVGYLIKHGSCQVSCSLTPLSY